MQIIDAMTILPGGPLFKEETTFYFDEHVNVFIGPNACGKTTLLRSIAEEFPLIGSTPFVSPLAPLSYWVELGAGWDPRSVYQELPGHNLSEGDVRRLDDEQQPDYDDDWEFKMFPCAFLPATRIVIPALNDIANRTFTEFFGVGTSLEYGDYNRSEAIFAKVAPRSSENYKPFDGDYSKVVTDISAFLENGNPFDNSHLLWLPMDNVFAFNAIMVEKLVRSMIDQFSLIAYNNDSTIINDYTARSHLSRIFTNLIHRTSLRGMTEVQRTAGSCARQIASEIIIGQPGNYTVMPDGFSARDWAVHPGMGITVLAGANSEVHQEQEYAGHLSAGTQGVYLWILYVALKIALHYKFESGWAKRPAVLFIDEIENHLHPTWQRRVIPALLDHFPGLQIFATTHSPFVVAGLKAGQAHMLKRDASGAVTASANERDIIGWTTDEILRTFMGVDEPTDQLTIDRANRLRELRDQETLSDAERDEMDELRRQVSEDFMSSSTPLETQRERYGDMMLEFLRSRQSDLSQDGA